MTFQASDLKGHHFFDLCNEYNNSLKPMSMYMKGRSWLKYFGHLNSLCMSVIKQECGQTWTRVRVKYYNY